MNDHKLLSNWKQVVFENDKPAYRYGLTLILVALCFGCLSLVPTQDFYSILKNLQIAAFITLGCVVAFRRTGPMAAPVKTGPGNRLVFTSTLALIFFILLFIMYLVTDHNQLFLAAASSGAFIIPSLLIRQWEIVDSIPEKKYEPWSLPAPGIQRKAVIALNSQSIQISFTPTYFDPHLMTITLIQPAREQLGLVFLHALELHHSTVTDSKISLSDESGNPYSWEFFEVNKLIGGERYLDPRKNLIDNNIKNNAGIIAKRLKQ